MDNIKLDTGMYIIDKDYKILNCNKAMNEMYPEVKVGDICYKSLAMSDEPCAVCPLVNNDVLFFNPIRKEWISANASEFEYPDHGRCYSVHFNRRVTIGGSKKEIIRMEKIDEHITDLQTSGGEGVMGAYIERGAPVFYADEKMVSLMGYDSYEEMMDAISGHVVNAIHPFDRARISSQFLSTSKEGELFEATFRMAKKDGEWFWLMAKGKVILTAGGEYANLCVCSDMSSFIKIRSDLEEQNRALLEKDVQNQSVFGRIPGGYHRCAAEDDYPFLYISDSFLKVVGWTREEIARKFDNKFLNMVMPEDMHLFNGLVDQIEDAGQGSVIYRIRCKGDTYKWVQDSTMFVDMGENSFYQCTLADISEFIDKQQSLAMENLELVEREKLVTTIAKNMPGGYHRCSVDEGFKLFFISDSFLEIVGYTEEELKTDIDNRYINLVAPEDREMFMGMEEALVRDGKINAVYRLVRKDGTRRWVQDATMHVKQGNQEFYQCTLADITEYVEQLNEEKEKAEASNRAKSAFLFNASHDIRTPMNAIQGFTQIIKNNPDDTELVKSIIDKIEKSGDTLMKLLNNVLELSRIESGKEEVDLSVVDINEFGDKLQTMLLGEITEKGIALVKEFIVTDSFVLADELKTTQIAMNMLSNAKKFTPAGGTITYGVEQTPCDDDEYAYYRFYVRDTGMGMSEEFLQKAFEQFERERTATESKVAGSGLGLSIIKKLTELLGGECQLESKLGEGTEIAAKIKLKKAQKSDNSGDDLKPAGSDFSGKRLLLVEDNDFNREIGRYILEGMGIVVEEAEDGSVAVNMLLNNEAGYYDLVLMDIQMPVLDGYLATQEIRRIENPEIANIPIVAMTANAFKEDRDRCIAVGMNEHLGKPIDTDKLVDILNKFI